MKLLYRGLSYNYTPGDAQTARQAWEEQMQAHTSYALSYRGFNYTVYPRLESRKAASQPIANLVYRGATYALNGWTVGSSVAKMATTTKTDVASVHRTNLYRNVERRLQTAKARGDQALVSVLERELQQIA